MRYLNVLLICSFILFIKEHFLLLPLIDWEDHEITGIYIEFKTKL